MTDEQLHRRMISKRLLIISAFLILLGAGLLYFRSTKIPELNAYRSAKAQESGLQSKVSSLQADIASKTNTINENGKQLVSFTEDKIVFINRASELATEHGVEMNEISVSDVWTEGQMSGMTTRVEVEGTLAGVRGFISNYCNVAYTNRITNVSCRPSDKYPWMYRYIDDLKVLQWLDLSEEEDKFKTEEQEYRRQQQQEILNNGGSVSDTSNQEDRSITLDDMFKQFTFKLYIQVDFLGRQ